MGDRSPKVIVNAFNQMGFFDHQPVAAMKTFLAEDFIERSPDFALEDSVSDKLAVIHFFETRGWKDGGTMRDTIYQVIGEGDRVVVFHHVTMSAQDRGIAFVDIFRVNDGLIAEHWAIGEPVPATTSLRHSMF